MVAGGIRAFAFSMKLGGFWALPGDKSYGLARPGAGKKYTDFFNVITLQAGWFQSLHGKAV
jgi:hypothetical protein